MKVCAGCNMGKTPEEFYACRRNANGLMARCKVCVNALGKAYREKNKKSERERRFKWRTANPEKHAEHGERARVKRMYGLTLEAYLEWFERAGHACAICGSTPKTSKHLHLDHCHATGRIRGVLCRGCNTALGHAKDCPKILAKLAAYLLEAAA
jgi:hypothetical protein